MSRMIVLFAVAFLNLQLTSGQNSEVVEDKDAKLENMPRYTKFPTITVCPVNKFRKSFLEAPENRAVMDYIHLLNNWDDGSLLQRLDDPSDNMYQIKDMKYEDLIRDGGFHDDRMLLCRMQLRMCQELPAYMDSPESFSIRENSADGRCWRVNPDDRILGEIGHFGSMELLFWADVQDHSRISERNGFVVTFHDNTTHGMAMSSSFLINPGTSNKANLRLVKAVRDKAENCIPFPPENSYGVQNMGSCVLECRDKTLHEKCGCVIIEPPLNTKGYRSCTLKQWAACGHRQYYEWYKNYTNTDRPDEFCPCSPPCTELRYQTEMSSSPFSPDYVDSILPKVQFILSDPNFGFSKPEFGINYNSSTDIMQNLVALEISLSSVLTTEIKEITVKDMPNDIDSELKEEITDTKRKPEQFKLPTITVCSLNKISKSYLEAPEKGALKEYFEMMESGKLTELADRIADPDDYMSGIRDMSYEDLIEDGGPERNRFIACYHKATVCHRDSVMENSATGRCWRVNPDGNMTGVVGVDDPLRLMFWADAQDYSSHSKDERKQAFVVTIHDDKTHGMAMSSSFLITPGTSNKANVRRVKVVRSGGGEMNCDPSPNENAYGTKNEGSCALECKDKALYKACGCVDVVPPINNEGYRSCTLEKWVKCGQPQYKEWHNNYTDTDRADNFCPCSIACEEVRYETELSSSSLSRDYVDSLFERVQSFISGGSSSGGLSKPEYGILYNSTDDIMDNLVVLEVSLTSPWMSEIKETLDKETSNLPDSESERTEEQKEDTDTEEQEDSSFESEPESVKFPTISVCSLNMFKRSYIEARENDEIKEIMYKMFYHWDTESSSSSNYSERVRKMRYEDLIQEGGPTKKLYVNMMCQQTGELCDTYPANLDPTYLDPIFVMENTAEGRCWRLNPDGKMRGKMGDFGKLKFFFLADVEDYSYFLSQGKSQGWSVKFHDSDTYGTAQFREFLLSPGVYYKANLKRTKEKREFCDPSLTENTYGAYNEGSCILECQDRFLHEQCGCVAIEPPLNNGKYRSCSLKEWIECGNNQRRNWYLNYTDYTDWKRAVEFCPCPTACEEVRYDAQISSSPLSPLYAEGIFPKLRPLFVDPSFGMSKPEFGILYNTTEDLMKNLMVLEVSLTSMWTTQTTDNLALLETDICISEIDAAFNHPTQNYAYVISHDKYIRLEPDGKNVPFASSLGYPGKVAEQWPGINGDVDAAFTDHRNGKTYFFVKSDPRRRVYCWNWRNSEMELNGVEEGESSFAALPLGDIEGIASYRDRTLILFENEYYTWSPLTGLNGEPQTWPEKSDHVDGPFDAFLSSSRQTLEKFVLLKSSAVIQEQTVETYSYERLEENMEHPMC